MRTFSVSLALALVIPTLACEVETLDVGDNFGGAAGTGGSGGAPNPNGQSGGMGGSPIQLPPEAPPRECDTDEALEKFVGVWEGVEEDFTFEPILPVRLEIRGASGSDVCGSFLYGELNPPPRASDPNAGYPPEPWGWNGTPRSVRLGFPYEISGGSRGTTLRISFSPYEVWKDWCAMQPPVFDLAGNAYPTCVENASGHRNDDGTCTFDTERGPVIYSGGKCDLCRMGPAAVCSCTEAGCEAMSNSPANYEFTLTEEEGVPTLTAPSSNNRNTQYRLQRVD